MKVNSENVDTASWWDAGGLSAPQRLKPRLSADEELQRFKRCATRDEELEAASVV